MSNGETISLQFDNSLKIAGEVVEGEVHLNFPGLKTDRIEEVHVKLRGFVYTSITRQIGQATQTVIQRVYFTRENISLWRVGDGVYPPADTDILKFPFKFTLPAQLPPSYEPSHGFLTPPVLGRIRYFVQVVGQRPGIWRFNERLLTPFPLLPPFSAGAELREALQKGWQGPWQTMRAEKSIRRGIWGEYSHVEMSLVLPDISMIPVFALIPYTLTIVAHTKSMKLDDKSSEEEVVFPAPPTTTKAVDFRLESDMFVRARSWKERRKNVFVAQLGGLGPKVADKPEAANVIKEVADKIWIPDEGDEKKSKGRWKQESVFKSFIQLNSAPDFDTETLNVKHAIKLKVDFPGVRNSLEVVFPVNVVSSMHPPGERAWDGPPPEFDLPPAYFQAGGWEKGDLEKD